MVNLYLGFLLLVGAERLLELALSRRNAARAFARGAIAPPGDPFAAIAVAHCLFLVACALEVLLLERPFPGAAGWIALALALLAQALRYWAVATLGDRWNVRVIVEPDAPPVTGGPYRWVRHPNYLAVIVELLCVPLVHGAWLTALVFGAWNAWLLRRRIRVEEAALGAGWTAVFASLPRFLPGARR